jgi:hypothetical protein
MVLSAIIVPFVGDVHTGVPVIQERLSGEVAAVIAG